MLSVEAARALIAETVYALGRREFPRITAAGGRVLRRAMLAPEDLPGLRSLGDGWLRDRGR